MSNRPELVRGIGLLAAIAVNVANMIGTGVFLKTRVMTCNVGDADTVLLVWIAAGLLSLAGTFSYAELSAMMPQAGGDYVFLRRAYGRFVGYLYGWTAFTVARAGSQAALAVGFAIFLNVAVGGGLDAPIVDTTILGLPLRIGVLTLVALAIIWLVALINCQSVTTGGNWALVLTIAKVALVLAVGVGAFAFATGDWSHLGQTATSGSCEGVADSARGGLAGFGAAMLGALWAYDGWNNVAPLSGEVRNPQRNLPLAFFGGILVVGTLYVFVNLAYFYVLAPTQIANVSTSSSVATEVLATFVGPIAIAFIAVSLMLSSFGSLHASVLANSRIPFAMAREGLFFKPLADVSPRTHVPVKAIVAQATWGSVLALSGSYDLLTDSVIFASWMFYGLSVGAVFVLRRTEPDAERPYRAFGYPFVPMIFIAVTIWLIVNTFIATPRLAFVGMGMMLAGVPFYLWWTRAMRGAQQREA